MEASLYPREIALDLDASGKTQLLEAVAKVLNGLCQIDAALIFRALRRREQAGSTAVGNGLAIPHARVPGIPAPVTLFARTSSPVRFGEPDGKPVSEFFVILVPAEGAAEAHLRLLAAVAELFSDTAFRARLAAAQSASAVAAAFARPAAGDAEGELEVLYGTS